MFPRKKISILIYSLAGGGAERVVSILLRPLLLHYDVYLVLMNDRIVYNIPPATKIHYLEKSDPGESGLLKFIKLPLLALRYKSFCRKEDISLSIAFMNRPSYVSLLAKLFGNTINTLVSERSTPSQIYSGRSPLAVVNRWLVKRLYPMADQIIANSLGNKADLVDNFRIKPDKIAVINNPVDIREVASLAKESVVMPGGRGAFAFVSVGRLDAGKNHQLLLQVVSELQPECDLRLYLLGDGPLRSELQHEIETLGMTNRVFLVGFDPNPYRWLDKADCFLFASRYEGFPNVLVEALACGLPVISTDCHSGPREILDPDCDGLPKPLSKVEAVRHGMLVPVDDSTLFASAVREFVGNEGSRLACGLRARERADFFSVEKIQQQYNDLFRQYLC